MKKFHPLAPPVKTLRFTFILLFGLLFFSVGCEKENETLLEVQSQQTDNNPTAAKTSSTDADFSSEKSSNQSFSNCECSARVVNVTPSILIWGVDEFLQEGIPQFGGNAITGDGAQWVGDSGLEALPSDWIIVDTPLLKLSQSDFNATNSITFRYRCVEVIRGGGYNLGGDITVTRTFTDSNDDPESDGCIYWETPLTNSDCFFNVGIDDM